MTARIKVLFVSANAPSSVRLPIRPEEEYRRIESRFRAGRHARLFQLLSLTAARIEDLQEGLDYHQPHVVHFAGHATPSGIELEDEHSRVVKVDVQALSQLFRAANSPAFGSGGNGLKLVVLHACSTASIAEALTSVVDFAVGMPNDVWDKDSINFAPLFYGSLFNGRSLKAALTSSFEVMRTKDYRTNHAPQLFHRPGADPAVPFIAHFIDRAVNNTQPPPAVEPARRPPEKPWEKKAKDGPPGKKNASRWRREEEKQRERDIEREQVLAARRKKR